MQKAEKGGTMSPRLILLEFWDTILVRPTTNWVLFPEFQGHHTNQACYKSGVMSPECHEELHNPLIKPQAILRLHQNKQISILSLVRYYRCYHRRRFYCYRWSVLK
jgi:hypothetical protein